MRVLSALLLCCGATVQLSAQDTIPIGFGTLKRDDIVVRFATDQVEIQVLPLAQSVIRLLLPDTSSPSSTTPRSAPASSTPSW